MKTSLPSSFFCLLSALLLLAGCVHQPREGKHLFILAGQSNMALLNPTERFIPMLEEKFGSENIIVVKDAEVAQTIRSWYKKWQPPFGDNDGTSGELYDRLMKKVRAAVGEQQLATITFIWMQGESDARSAYYADIYEQNMLGLYAQLQEDFQRQDINWVIGRISDYDINQQRYKRWKKIREIQQQVAASNPRFFLVDTDDLNDGIKDPKRRENNDLHYSDSGLIVLGQRFANSAILLIQRNDY